MTDHVLCSTVRARFLFFTIVLSLYSQLAAKVYLPMTSNFSEAISALRIHDPSPASTTSDGPISEYGRSVESNSSIESSYTRRGQTETDADIRAGLAAARDLASRKKQYSIDKLSSSPGPAHIHLPPAGIAVRDNKPEAEPSTSGTKTPLPDTSTSLCYAKVS
jgi:hypothetical protein